MRNHIPPGRVCLERSWIESDEQDYETAEIIYTILFAATFKTASLKRLASLLADPIAERNRHEREYGAIS
jgi:hypothetical protein